MRGLELAAPFCAFFFAPALPVGALDLFFAISFCVQWIYNSMRGRINNTRKMLYTTPSAHMNNERVRLAPVNDTMRDDESGLLCHRLACTVFLSIRASLQTTPPLVSSRFAEQFSCWLRQLTQRRPLVPCSITSRSSTPPHATLY